MPSKPVLLKFKIEDFENLPSEQGEATFSEQQTDSKENAWDLQLYPGGDGVEHEGRVSLFLCLNTPKEVHAKYSIILRNKSGGVFKERRGSNSLWGENKSCGFRIVKRSVILDQENDILVDGALLVDVELQYMDESPPYKHPSSLSRNMLQLLENVEDSDIAFEVGRNKFNAHKNILRVNAPVLFSFSEGNDGGSPVPIKGISPNIFRILLRYVYGEEIPDTKVIMNDGKKIIDASNMFGVTGLKLAVEAVLVESSIFTVENVADWLIFSDSKVCPLLKEHATAYFATRLHDILRSESSNQLKESPQLLTELMMETSNSSMDDRFGNERNASVEELRKQLLEKGLDIDGSKEILVSRLRESNKRQRVD